MSYQSRKISLPVCALWSVLFASLPGLALAQTAADPVVARAGNITIGQKEVEQLFITMPPAERAAVKADSTPVSNWLRQRLASETVLAEAMSKGWGERPEVKARLELAKREITARLVNSAYLESVAALPAGYPSDAELKAAYDKGRPDFKVPDTYKLAQIFLAAPAGDAAAVASQREAAKKLAAEARRGDFAALARSKSQDQTTAQRGGEVGTLPVDQITPEIRAEVVKLKAGAISEPLQSPAGFHIVRMIEIVPAHTATLEEVKPGLQTLMRQQRQQQLALDYANSLAPASALNVDTAVLDATLKKLQ
ncbi:MAG: peptidylprolyl isomerase [Janthinobacterium lividum]